MSETEQQFLREIDCRFPYHDETKWKSVVDRGCAISSTAALAVLYEICAPGGSRERRPNPALLQAILDYWESRFDHPVKEIVLPAAVAMIQGKLRSEEETIKAMEKVAPHHDLGFALIVLDCACDDVNGNVEAKYTAICKDWDVSRVERS